MFSNTDRCKLDHGEWGGSCLWLPRAAILNECAASIACWSRAGGDLRGQLRPLDGPVVPGATVTIQLTSGKETQELGGVGLTQTWRVKEGFSERAESQLKSEGGAEGQQLCLAEVQPVQRPSGIRELNSHGLILDVKGRGGKNHLLDFFHSTSIHWVHSTGQVSRVLGGNVP